MPTMWISAAKAKGLVFGHYGWLQDTVAICKRAHAGIVVARARQLVLGDQVDEYAAIPHYFWRAEGQDLTNQNWSTGDFTSELNRLTKWHAYGVEFELSGIVEMLPVEHRALALRSFSVEADPDWIPARLAYQTVAKDQGISLQAAQRRLIDLGKLGFVAARAVQMTLGREPTDTRPKVEREWDIPEWFWQKFTLPDRSSQDWATGTFGGRATGIGRLNYMRLTGVHFHRATVITPEANSDDQLDDDESESVKTPLPDGLLAKWWAGKAAIRDGLTREEIAALLRAAFPDNHVARDRIRDMTGPRKKGPKPIGG